MITYYTNYAILGTYKVATSYETVYLIGDDMTIHVAMSKSDWEDFLEEEGCTMLYCGDDDDRIVDKARFEKDIECYD